MDVRWKIYAETMGAGYRGKGLRCRRTGCQRLEITFHLGKNGEAIAWSRKIGDEGNERIKKGLSRR
jgi:hypothetical protein